MERLYSVPRGPLALLLVALLIVLVLAGKRLAAVGSVQAPAAPAALTETSGRGRSIVASDARLVVHVVGAVRRAGLYRLPDGSRVADAVARAGGATRRAELAAVNLAAPLADGQQVIVPRRVPTGSPTATGGGGSVAGVGGKVSLGVATIDDLDELPGIGPVTAQKIVDWRAAHGPFASVDDLDAVPGIGPSRVEQLRELVTP